MVHHEAPLAAELVPDCKGRADGAARVAGRGLYVDAPERRHSPHLAVGDRVHRAAAGQRKIGQSAALLQDTEEVKKCLLVHDLRRAGDVAMTIFKRVGRKTPWPKQMLERGRKQIAKFWGSVRP